MKYLLGFLLVWLGLGQSFAASPELHTSSPRGGQRGKEVEVTFTGKRLFDTTAVVFYKPGITAKKVKPIDGKKVVATIAISANCELGEHHFRLLGKSGFSYARTFWVGPFKEIKEVEPNDEFSNPQKIELNTTVAGVAKPEEVDYYQISAKQGQRISVEMEALRINNVKEKIAMDPYVAILDENKKVIAYSDDSALLKQESVISIIAPKDGNYVILIRDSSYQGNGVYRAHISTTPRPLSVYPAGGTPGSEIEFTYLGDPTGPYKNKSKLPTEQTSAHYLFGKQQGQNPVSGNKIRINSLVNILEQEPNNLFKDKSNPTKPLPLAFNGILEKPNDEDIFRFSAKKGERFIFNSYANRLNTPVDSVISIFDSKLKRLGGNDDNDNTKDSKYDFKCPADGDYTLQVKDRLGAGGAHHVYRVETEKITKKIEVTMPEMLRRDNQYRKQFNIPQGNYYAMNVNIRRENMSGELVFDLPKLPKGVTWQAGTIPKDQNQFPILFKAEPKAPLGGDLYELIVKNTDQKNPLSGRYTQSIDFVRGNPNGTSYYGNSFAQLPIAVTEKVPFRVTIEQPSAPIIQDGTMRLKVRAHRDEGYDKKIVVKMLWRPPGISTPSTMTFGEKATELEYEVNANGSAQIKTWKICVLAESDAGKGLIKTASPFVNLQVEKPYAKMKINMASIKQGEQGVLHCSLENLRKFSGPAEVQLFGLPVETTSSVIKINKDTKELQIPIKTTNKSPIGQHKNLFCTLVVMDNGEQIQHRIGMGGILRIDPKQTTPSAPKKEPTKKESKKPLTRLEQLRLEAKQGN